MPDEIVIAVPEWARTLDPGWYLVAGAVAYYLLTAIPARWLIRKGWERGFIVTMWLLSWFILPLTAAFTAVNAVLWVVSLGVVPSPRRVWKSFLYD